MDRVGGDVHVNVNVNLCVEDQIIDRHKNERLFPRRRIEETTNDSLLFPVYIMACCL